MTAALGGEMLLLAGVAATPEDGAVQVSEAISSGRAAEVFGRMVTALGGPADIVERPVPHLADAPLLQAVYLDRRGIVGAIDARAIGVGVIELGGGRRRAADRIDHAVGYSSLAAIGSEVAPDRPLGIVHARTASEADAAAIALRGAYQVGEEQPALRPVVYRRLDAMSLA